MADKKENPLSKTFDGSVATQGGFNPREIVDRQTGATRLLQAVDSYASHQKIYEILKDGADPNQPDFSGRTPIQAAYDKKLWRVGELLMRAGSNPPELEYEGGANGYFRTSTAYDQSQKERDQQQTWLTYMCKNANWYGPIFQLLANGADPNKRNKFGDTPLQIVAKERPWSYTAVQLVKHGAWIDPDKRDPDEIIDPKTGATRLLAVIMEGQDGHAVKRILEQGADPNKPDKHGLTPLALACALQWPFVEKLLIEHGANPDVEFPDPNQMCGAKGDTPLLIYAATYQCSHNGYIAALIDAGADVDAVDKDGRTATYWAGVYGKNWLFDEMEAAGADLFKTECEGGTTPLQIACLNGNVYIADRLLELKPEEILRVSEKSGDTLLHLACGRNGSVEIVQLLADLGANVNQANENGTRPIASAASAGRTDIVQCLIENGADVAKGPVTLHDNDIFFTLGNHHDEGRFDAGKLLLKHGADPNRRAARAVNGPSEGDHILYYSVSYRTYELAEELLKAGADVYGLSSTGETAMHHCLNLRQIEGVKLLLRHGFDPLKQMKHTHSEYHNGEKEEYDTGCAHECAKALVKQFGHDSEYGKMLDIIEDHLKAEGRLPETPAQKERAKPKSGPAL